MGAETDQVLEMFSTVTRSGRFKFCRWSRWCSSRSPQRRKRDHLSVSAAVEACCSERSDAMMVGGDASARRVDVRLQSFLGGRLARPVEF